MPEEDENTEENRKLKKPLMAGAGVVVIAVVTAGFLIATRIDDSTTHTHPSSPINIEDDPYEHGGQIQISLTELGNADYVLVRGNITNIDSGGLYYLENVGESLNFTRTEGHVTSDQGSLSIVAIIRETPTEAGADNVGTSPADNTYISSGAVIPRNNDTKTTIQNFEWDFQNRG